MRNQFCQIKVYEITSLDKDEYPDDPRLGKDITKDLLDDMGLKVEEGDLVEITARIISRVEIKRVPVKE